MNTGESHAASRPVRIVVVDDHPVVRLGLTQLLVKKHAGVDRAEVRMTEQDGHLVIRVSDAGAGFDPEEVEARGHPRSFGLSSIRERLRLLGGRLEIRSRADGGTQIEVHAPVSPGRPERGGGR